MCNAGEMVAKNMKRDDDGGGGGDDVIVMLMLLNCYIAYINSSCLPQC